MTISRKVRLIVLTIATGTVLALACRDTYRLFQTRHGTLRQVDELRRIQQEESLGASNIPSAIRELDRDCLGVASGKDPRAAERFKTHSRELGEWIQERRELAQRAKVVIF